LDEDRPSPSLLVVLNFSPDWFVNRRVIRVVELRFKRNLKFVNPAVCRIVDGFVAVGLRSLLQRSFRRERLRHVKFKEVTKSLKTPEPSDNFVNDAGLVENPEKRALYRVRENSMP